MQKLQHKSKNKINKKVSDVNLAVLIRSLRTRVFDVAKYLVHYSHPRLANLAHVFDT